VKQLINSVRLRWLGEILGFEKISLKNEKMKIQFVSGKDDYFKSAVFGKILSFVQQNSKSSRMRDSAGKLTLTLENITSVEKAIDCLNPITHK
jgi:transcription-repair coupling factor (superfamily II helicase)